MKVLALNCGSSSLKFRLFEVAREAAACTGERGLARGIVDRIGDAAAVAIHAEDRELLRETVPVAHHGEATQLVLGWLASSGLLEPEGMGVVGHRVVHGADRFVAPILIDDGVIDAIDALSSLAPLHNQPALGAIRAALSVLGPGIPEVAVFDTAFHHGMPPRASRYAIPYDLAEKHRIRRYGFHGIAHRSMVDRHAALASAPVERSKLVTLQLGNGCSAAAVAAGRSIDTSMGFTPLEGLMMGTRSGDVDPSLAGFLAGREELIVARDAVACLRPAPTAPPP